MAVSVRTGMNLMDEIYDQVLLCKICYEVYKVPKTLSCLHTFCADCLDRHVDAEAEKSHRYLLYTRPISCPICRKKTEFPSGGVRRLPDNFLLSSLTEILSYRRPSKNPLCEICKPVQPRSDLVIVSNNGNSGATSYARSRCLDCNKLLCPSCVESHRRTKVTKSHNVFDIQIEKDTICKVHTEDVIRFYCEACETCICVVCTFQEHKGHSVISFAEGLQKYRNLLLPMVMTCKERLAQANSRLKLMDDCETELKRAEERIREAAIETIAAVRRREKEMLGDLYSSFGEETLEYIKQRDSVSEMVDDLRETCSLSDLVFKEESMELLLLKKELQEKIRVLLANKLNSDPPPQALTRQVQFIPGRFVFGYLNVDGQAKSPSPAVDETGQVENFAVRRESRNTPTQTDRRMTFDQATSMPNRWNCALLPGLVDKMSQTGMVYCEERSCNTETYAESGDNSVKKSTSMQTDSLPVVAGVEQYDNATQYNDDSFTSLHPEGTNLADEEVENIVPDKHLKVVLVDASTSAIGVEVSEKEVSAIVDTAAKEVSTRAVETADKETATKAIPTLLDTSTAMEKVSFSEKETYMPQIHQMHKNVSTENTIMFDKQTSTTDVAAGYKEAIFPYKSRSHLISRGTNTMPVSISSIKPQPASVKQPQRKVSVTAEGPNASEALQNIVSQVQPSETVAPISVTVNDELPKGGDQAIKVLPVAESLAGSDENVPANDVLDPTRSGLIASHQMESSSNMNISDQDMSSFEIECEVIDRATSPMRPVYVNKETNVRKGDIHEHMADAMFTGTDSVHEKMNVQEQKPIVDSLKSELSPPAYQSIEQKLACIEETETESGPKISGTTERTNQHSEPQLHKPRLNPDQAGPPITASKKRSLFRSDKQAKSFPNFSIKSDPNFRNLFSFRHHNNSGNTGSVSSFDFFKKPKPSQPSEKPATIIRAKKSNQQREVVKQANTEGALKVLGTPTNEADSIAELMETSCSSIENNLANGSDAAEDFRLVNGDTLTHVEPAGNISPLKDEVLASIKFADEDFLMVEPEQLLQGNDRGTDTESAVFELMQTDLVDATETLQTEAPTTINLLDDIKVLESNECCQQNLIVNEQRMDPEALVKVGTSSIAESAVDPPTEENVEEGQVRKCDKSHKRLTLNRCRSF